MKKKYYFVILFLMLTMFFIINTSSVNATVYKILDSEGNIVRITDQPTLSIKEKEAGYTISPPPDDYEINLEVLGKSEEYDFIITNWGMGKEEVKMIEKAEFIEENRGEDDLQYKGKVGGFDCYISYFFKEGKLMNTGCRIIQTSSNKEDYINDYKKLREYLINKYGKPFQDYLYDSKWDTPITEIQLYLSEVNNVYDLLIYFKSKSETKFDTEKEKAKKEAEAQIEARIKELENKPKAEIKIIDSTNYLSGSGNYYYVEGILKNNGKGTAYSVKVEVRALDKYDKIVSIDDVYADPSTLAPGQEATYQIMVEYDSKIDKFDKEVSWSVEPQTEAPIKEKYKINIVDWNNRLSISGNYIYVEGSLKNIGNQTAEKLRIIVKSLDTNGKLVSIDDGYTNPSLIAPNKEAIFQIMLNNNYKIKKFSLIVLTESAVFLEVDGIKEKPLAKQIININTASLEELMCVLEISEHTAIRVISRRKEMEGFKNPKDITFLFEIGTIEWEKWIERGIVIKV